MWWYNVILGFVFIFPLVLCIVIYDKEYQTKESKT